MASRNNLKELVIAADQSHKERDYWLTKLSGDLVKSHFPYESQLEPGNRQKNMHTRRINFHFTGEFFTRIMKMSNQSDVRIYIIMVTGLVILLYKYTSNRDIIVGTPTYKQDVEGELINTVLALRNQVNPDASCKELLLQVGQNIFEANENQNYPIEALLYNLGMPQKEDDFSLFDTAFLLKNLHEPGYLNRVPINMIFSFLRTAESIEGELRYNGKLFNEASAQRIAAHFKCTLEEILLNIDSPVSSIRVLTPEEKKQLIADFNDNRAEFSTDKSVCHFIEDHTQYKPDKIALVYDLHQVSYRQLNERADRSAAYLLETGVGRDQVVGILLNRSPLMVESILAVWKAGGAYLPIDPGYPEERVNYILTESGANMLVTTSILAKDRKEVSNWQGNKIFLDVPGKRQSTTRGFLPAPINLLAYVIYTSGSTGKPKGACVEHIGMMNHINAKINDLDLSGHSIIAQNAPHNFDISVWQFFTALTLGGHTVIYPDECILAPAQFLSRLTRDRIAILEFVPSYLSVLLDFILDHGAYVLPPSLMYLLVTGEEIKPALIEKWFETYPGIPMVNAYGPTEASDDITHYIMEKAPDRPSIPIGKSLRNMSIYIVDDDMQLCPIGVKGEICVSGIGVGRGYLNNPELTFEKFVNCKLRNTNQKLRITHKKETTSPRCPITPFPHYPIYLTGDLGRWLPDGNIEFFGRKDYQVKIRGFRIELGEIEKKLSSHPDIKQAVVIDREDNQGNKNLCAYVVENVEAPEPANVLRFQEYLKERLPEYMIPSYFVLLEEIPLTPNGKVDRKALPAPDPGTHSPIKYVTIEMLEQMEYNKSRPRGLPNEKSWEGLDNIVEILRKEETVLATYSKEIGKNYYPLNHAQKMVYYVEKTYPGTSCENDGYIVLYTGEFQRELLEQAINTALERNEGLRTRVKEIESGDFFGPAQYVTPYKAHSFDYFEFPGKEGKKDLKKWVGLNLDKPFQFIDGVLYYFTIIKLDRQYGYYIKHHHIIADGNSAALAIHEIDSIYQDLIKGKPVDRTLNPSHIKYIPDEREYLYSSRAERDRQYFLNNLIPLPREAEINSKKGDAFDLSGNSIKLNFTNDLRSRLHDYRKNHDTSIYKLILSALSIYIFHANGLDDFVIGTLNHGRFRETHQKMVGMFIKFLPAHIRIDSGMEYQRFLQEVGIYINDLIKNRSMYPDDLLSTDLKKITGRDSRYFWNITLIGHPDKEKKAFQMEHISSNDEATPLVIHINISNKDIEGTLELEWVYQVDQFTPEHINRIHHHLMTILTQALDQPGKKLSEFDFLSAEEKKQVPAETGNNESLVEIEGNKIETADIERVLQAYPPVEKAAAAVKKDKKGAPYLCGYVTAGKSLTADELQEHLLKHFSLEEKPVYSLQLEQIPLTSDGKVDHRLLEAIDINMYTPIGRQAYGYEAPRNELEEKLVEIWQNVLGKKRISINDNFFTIGGDSIKTIQIASRMSKTGCRLEMKDIFRNPTIAQLASILKNKEMPDNTPGQEQELIPGQFTYKELPDDKLEQINRTYHPLEIEDIYPLTPLQEGMLFLALYDRNSFAYFEQTSYRLEGDLNITLVEKSINQLFKRHAVLRTVFINEGLEQPLQVVFKKREVDFTYQDMRGLVAGKQEEKKACVMEFREKDKQRFFDLVHDVLMRVSILHLDESEYEFTWSFHHILMDGWCIGIVISEFFEIYNSFLDNRPYQLPGVKPYRNYIQWLEQQDKNISKDYWEKYLEDYEEAASIPQMSVLPKTGEGYKSEQAALELGKGKTDRLKRLTAANQVTLNTLVQTLWAIILGKYNCSEDVVFGVVVSGRPSTVDGVESMVGLFINTIPVRIIVGGSMTFRQVLTRVQENALRSEPHHYYSLGHIQATHILKQNLLDHIFVFENYPVAIQVEGFREVNKGTNARSLFRLSDIEAFAQTNFDFNIIVQSSEQLSITFLYNANRYREDFILRMTNHLSQLVDQVLENQDQEIARITILSSKEKEQLLYEFNLTYWDYPRAKTIFQLFETQVELTPNRLALVGMGVGEETRLPTQLTYRQVYEKATQLGQFLQTKNIRANIIVGILMERSIEILFAILGILKAGGAYLPIEPTYPGERIDFMLNDSGAKILVTTGTLSKNVKTGIEYIFIDSFEPSDFSSSHRIDSLKSCPSDPAYIIYTSGSTGTPKGVPITHSNFSPLIHWGYQLDMEPGERVIQNISYHFDWSVWEIFITLTTGATLFTITREILLNPGQEVDFILRHAITVLHVTPSHHHYLIDTGKKLKTLKYLFIGAEKLTNELVKLSIKLVNPGCRIFNMYGPSEATIISSVLEIERENVDRYDALTSVPIGKPVGNTVHFVLDRYLNLCPIQVVGELYIAGDGVASGYLNNPELAGERFLKFPHQLLQLYESKNKTFLQGTATSHWKHKLYKTGDSVRWLEDGNIEFLGRIDSQIKIRGYRIELGEIESQLLQIDGITQACVAAHEKKSGQKYLCAYYVSRQTIDSKEARNILELHLPDYMIPSHFIPLERIPLTPGGKVDLRALPEPDSGRAQDFIAPQTPNEKIISNIWQQVLKLEHVGIDSNFFDLGGTSLDTVMVKDQLKELFKKDIQLITIFRYPTIRLLAAYLMDMDKEGEKEFTGEHREEALERGKKDRMRRLQKKRDQ